MSSWCLLSRRGSYGCDGGGFAVVRPKARRSGPSLYVGWFLWSFGYRHQVQSFWHAGAVVMAMGGLLTVVGKDVFFKFLPAFAVLVFLVPIPLTGGQLLAIPLERITADVTQKVAEVIGMNVERQGNLLMINGVKVAVVEACNGMRMVFTLFLACYVFAFVTPLRGYVCAIILIASPITAVVCNVIRLVPTVWLFGHLARPDGRSLSRHCRVGHAGDCVFRTHGNCQSTSVGAGPRCPVSPGSA